MLEQTYLGIKQRLIAKPMNAAKGNVDWNLYKNKNSNRIEVLCKIVGLLLLISCHKDTQF